MKAITEEDSHLTQLFDLCLTGGQIAHLTAALEYAARYGESGEIVEEIVELHDLICDQVNGQLVLGITSVAG